MNIRYLKGNDFKIFNVKCINVMLSLLDVLSVNNLIFESIPQRVGEFDEYLALFRYHYNMAARFKDSEKSQINQDFIQQFHVVNEIDLESEILLI